MSTRPPAGLARSALRWLAAAALPLAGCADAEPDLVLGTGEIEYVPLEAGDELEVIRGPQNGFHVLGAIRTMGLVPGDARDLASPRNPTIVFTLTAEGTEWQFPDTIVQGLRDAPGAAAPWTHEMLNRRVILDILSDEELDGFDGTLAVTISDADGVELSRSVDVFLVPSPDNDNDEF